jgi:hypothetical protein
MAASGAGYAQGASEPVASAPVDEMEVAPLPPGKAIEASKELSAFCFFSGKPPMDAKYSIVRALKVGKGSYGNVVDIVPTLAQQARALGADAMIDYTGSQRFGFWPWRMVRPVVRGVAVRWNEAPAKGCEAMGGSTLQTIIATNKAPGPGGGEPAGTKP